MTDQTDFPRKKRRISRACDDCHRRSVRCKSSEDPRDQRCRTCIEFGQACTYNREARRRGVKPRSQTTSSTPASAKHVRTEISVPIVTEEPRHATKSARWEAAPVASQAVVMDLVEIYFELVYPIFPFFHRPTFVRKIARGEHMTDKFLFAVTMAICALVSARIRDGALSNPQWDTRPLLNTASEVFYDVANRECRGFIPADAFDLNLQRASALLAIASIQAEDPAQIQMHLGRYLTLSATSGAHDETQWPKHIGIVETEERRRLFWSIYTLELFTSIVWNGVSRCREQQCNVSYPTELDDEQFDDSGYRATAESPLIIGPSPTHSGRYSGRTHWIAGWNFTTDLYRVLEHVITHFRDRRKGRESFLSDIFGDRPTINGTFVRESIMNMYAHLPQCFKETPPITYSMSSDRYGFQAANITATMQLLRMVLFTSSDGTIEERCQIASEVVDAFMHIPIAYLQAISSPLLHHLTGIGAILGSVLGEPLSQTEYQSIRTVLLSLAQLLENMDHGVHSTQNAMKLRSLVTKIDEYMDSRQGFLNLIKSHNQRNLSSSQLDRHAMDVSSPNLTVSYSTGMRTIATDHDVDVASDHDSTKEVPSNVPFQLPTELLDDWPWAVDFLQLQES